MTEVGVVESFDVERGDGWVLDDRDRRLFLHCVMIADGSRRINPGTRVRFTRAVGLMGSDEARDVVAL
ncbi:MAG: cold shock domain-containing protein [Acidobacteria bacterium]|nr:cold shock domain-containing protein [Acidobacteriota bacterium]